MGVEWKNGGKICKRLQKSERFNSNANFAVAGALILQQKGIDSNFNLLMEGEREKVRTKRCGRVKKMVEG